MVLRAEVRRPAGYGKVMRQLYVSVIWAHVPLGLRGELGICDLLEFGEEVEIG